MTAQNETDGAAVAMDPAAAADALSMGFTPRSGVAKDDPPLVRFRVDLDGGAESERIGRLGFAGGNDLQPGVMSGASNLLVGGAVEFGDWSVGGAYQQFNLLGNQADLMSATLGYGSLSTSLSYGQTETQQGPPMDVMLLSTDLAAWSWLTLQSDVLVGKDGRTEPMAAGRVGFRLKF
ncbi:MAG: hypothetical protein U1E45_04805 [Geminicoccaceae bacterium]